MFKLMLVFSMVALASCASQTKESVLSSEAVAAQKASYFETKSELEKDSKDDFTQKILSRVEGMVSVSHGSNPSEPTTTNIVVPANIATWVVYPYEDRFGTKFNMSEVNMMISKSSWYSDHGASLNRELSGSDKNSEFSPYYHVKGKGK